MKCLVTGGLGFIGSHLTKALIENGHEVHIIDNLHDYYDPSIKQSHLYELKQMGTFHYVSLDLLDQDQLSAFFQNEGPFDMIIHLAALPGVRYSLTHPEKYVDIDIKATVHILQMCHHFQVPHFLFASSSSVYGEGFVGPCAEHMANGTNLISPYAVSKWSAELFVRMYAKLYGFDATILRFFTVYGPKQRPDMAIHRFISSILQGKELSLYGLETYRDYTYVDDIVKGILKAMNKTDGIQVYNLGSGKPVKLRELIELLESKLNREIQKVILPRQVGDVSGTWADISLSYEHLGYQPTTTLSEGLDQSIQWLKSR
jgi:UDP-glucuronate 4-epimerase